MHQYSAIEPLEDRIAPATLVSPTTVTFQDKNGDTATVTISKPLFTPANVAKVFTFDTGGVDGSNSAKQQLETLAVHALGSSAKGIDISITATPVGGSSGTVDVGYIDAQNIDLGNVTVAGDLGRIEAGDRALATNGLHSLTVESMGAHGVGTQAAGGTLISKISGPVSSITINGDLDGADIGIGGGAKAILQNLKITGNINGGAVDHSGSVRTQGGIGSLEVDGAIVGGGGLESGVIGTAGVIGSALVKGSITGGGGQFSGAVLSTKGIVSIEVDGSLLGGDGANSGQLGTAGQFGTGLVKGGIIAGAGALSGTVLASGNIQSVTVGSGIVGGGGPGAGQIGTASGIGSVDITGGMLNGAEIHAHGSIQKITIRAAGVGNAIDHSAIDAGGSIGSITAIGQITNSLFVAGTDFAAGFGAIGAGTFDNTSAAAFGFANVAASAGGSIGSVTVQSNSLDIPSGIDHSTFLAGIRGKGGDGNFGTKDDVAALGGSVGPFRTAGALTGDFVEAGSIGATTVGSIDGSTYIALNSALSAGGIGAVTVNNMPVSSASVRPQGGAISTVAGAGITNSTFISNSGIGPISVGASGTRGFGFNAGIANSTFTAGHGIGSITVINSESGSNGSNYGIYNSTFNAGGGSNGGVGDIRVSMTDSGPNGGTVGISGVRVDGSACDCSGANLGSISVENDDTSTDAVGIQNSVFRINGNIGPISATMGSGSPTASGIEGSIFSAFGSIGDINVYGAVTAGSKFLAGYDIGSDMIFGNEILTSRSVLNGGQSIGNVNITGYFEGSDIIASVNPGSGYLFGDSASNSNASNDSHAGKGGNIGLVTIGANLTLDTNPFRFDHAVQHGIEALHFASGPSGSATVSAFGSSTTIPTVLYVDGGANDVRITDLTQAPAV